MGDEALSFYLIMEVLQMNKMFSVFSVGVLALISSSAYATAVPEIDGSNAAIGIGLTVGVLALVKEYCRKK